MLFCAFAALVVACVAFWRAYRDHADLLLQLAYLQRQLHFAHSHLKRRSYLASEIAHDIKNPLTAILCSAEALDMTVGKDLDPVNRRSLHFIREYGEDLLRLLGDFLDINRIQTGHLESRKERVQVSKVCESVVGLLAAYAERREVTVQVAIMSELSPAWIDPTHLKQILFNLLHNAIKFSDAESEVTIVLSGLPEAHALSISVVDTGAGIPEDKIGAIFDPYERFENGSAPGDVGQGLGLALCRALAELEGGEISVSSRYGEGTTFTVIVPADRDAIDQPVSAELVYGGDALDDDFGSGEYSVLSGHRILVLDENPGARESMARLIETWGAVVDSAQEVEQALRAIDACRYDAIVVDDSEGGQHAARVAQLIRKNLDNHPTRIIVSQSRDSSAIVEGEIDLVVEKPLNSRKILAALLPTSSFH